METNQLVRSNSNVILTRQTCGQRSSRVAGSKRTPSASIHFSVRIWYVFIIPKGRGQSDLGLCMTSVFAKRMQLHSADFRRILRPNTFLNRKSSLCRGILFASTKVMHRPRSDSPLHFEIKNTYQICMLAFGVCFPQRWPQVCRVKITFEILRTNWFVSTRTNSKKCKVDATEYARSFEPNPTLP